MQTLQADDDSEHIARMPLHERNQRPAERPAEPHLQRWSGRIAPSCPLKSMMSALYSSTSLVL
jgi:hypothetical protein